VVFKAIHLVEVMAIHFEDMVSLTQPTAMQSYFPTLGSFVIIPNFDSSIDYFRF